MKEFENEMTMYEEFLARKMQNPVFRAAYEDEAQRDEISTSFMLARKAIGLKQEDLARRAGRSQSAVSGFESSGRDPLLSTLQNYARALGGHIEVKLVVPIPAKLTVK